MADAQSTANRAIEMRRARGRAYYYRHREKILEIERAKREPARIAARNRAIEQGRRPHGEGRDLDKRKATRRAWYARNPDARRKHAENAAAYRHKSPEARERWRQWKRNARAKKGATRRATTLERAKNRLVEQNARQAWRWWLKSAPDWWIAAYYSALGTPWSNPRLSAADAYRMRYVMDPAYAQRERERVSARRFAQPEYGAQWERNGCRWIRAAQSADGSITQEFLRLIRRETHCAYCGEYTKAKARHLDHVWPLARGGRHSADNLVMACADCNRSKSDKMPMWWMLQRSGSLSASGYVGN